MRRTPLPLLVASLLAVVGCRDAAAPGDGTDTGAVASGPTLAAGSFVSCAIDAQHAAYCWGSNGLGTLGNPAVRTDTGRPVPVVGGGRYVAITLNTINQIGGPFTACALTADGAADCWGSNPAGLLGPADAVTCVDSGRSLASTGPCTRVPTRVAPTLRFRRLTVGWGHLCGITTGDETVCWGRGSEGQLGSGATATTTSPGPVAGGRRYVDVAAGDKFTCALDAGGDAYCWGLNDRGQLGDGTTTSSPVPVRVRATEALAQLDVGSDDACAVTRSGTALCWGNGDFRKLGTEAALTVGPTAGSRYAPVPVMVAVPAGTARVSVGVSVGCALDTTGHVRCWGWNPYGQVGTTDPGGCTGSDLSAACLPSSVLPALTFAEISAGGLHACARTVAGAVYCWGSDPRGEVGDGARTLASPPTRVPIP